MHNRKYRCAGKQRLPRRKRTAQAAENQPAENEFFEHRCRNNRKQGYPDAGGKSSHGFLQHILKKAQAIQRVDIGDTSSRSENAGACDLSLDPGYRARSFLEFDRDKERTLEFHSFSKSYSMQGWRVGFAAGSADAVANLLKIKSNMDFGVFMAIQRAGLAVLNGPQDYCADAAKLYRRRGEAFRSAIAPLGYPCELPRATLYLWLPIPRRFTRSLDFTAELLDTTGVVVGPGSGFGQAGEGFVRMALCVDESRCREAGERMTRAGYSW